MKFVDKLYFVGSINYAMSDEQKALEQAGCLTMDPLSGEQEDELSRVLQEIMSGADVGQVEHVEECIFDLKRGVDALLSYSDINVYRDGGDIVVLCGDYSSDETERYVLQPMDVAELVNKIRDGHILSALGIEQ